MIYALTLFLYLIGVADAFMFTRAFGMGIQDGKYWFFMRIIAWPAFVLTLVCEAIWDVVRGRG